MAKWWSEGEGHGVLVPRKDTEVRVDAEELSFVVAPELTSAEVTATYHMTNGGKAASSANVAFVMVASEAARHGAESASKVAHAEVTIDGATVPSRLVTEADVLDPNLDQDSMKAEVKALQSQWSKRGDDAPLSWLLFPLTIPAGASRTVVVRYRHVAGSDASHAVNTVFTYDYLLSPARQWARFGDLAVEVRLPADAEVHASSLPFHAEDGGKTYRARLSGLPDKELTFELMSRRGLLFGMTQPTGYWLLLLAVMSLVTVPAAAALGRLTQRMTSPLARALARLFGVGVAALVWNGVVAWAVSAVVPQRAFGYSYGAAFGLLAAVGLLALTAVIVSFMVRPRPA